MWSVTWNVHWGTRSQNTFVTLYFTRKPSNDEILKTFRSKGHRLYEKFYQPACSGMVTVKKLETEF